MGSTLPLVGNQTADGTDELWCGPSAGRASEKWNRAKRRPRRQRPSADRRDADVHSNCSKLHRLSFRVGAGPTTSLKFTLRRFTKKCGLPKPCMIRCGEGRRCLKLLAATSSADRRSNAHGRRYNISMPKQRRYTPDTPPRAGRQVSRDLKLANQFPEYEIVIDDPEFTSVVQRRVADFA